MSCFSYLHTEWPRIKEELLNGTHAASRTVEYRSGTRMLGIPTSERLIQQAFNQVLSPIFEPHFSEYS